MKYLYLISQKVNNNYDTYSGAVVCAGSEQEARETHPTTWKKMVWRNNRWENMYKGEYENFYDSEWVDIKDVSVVLIGTASEELEVGVVCASFHAG